MKNMGDPNRVNVGFTTATQASRVRMGIVPAITNGRVAKKPLFPVGFLFLILACGVSHSRAQNTATGANALVNVTPAGTSGTNNTADGANALQNDTTGSVNTATGFSALSLDPTGSLNVADGAYALFKSAGTFNIGLGAYSLQANSVASENVAIGYVSLYASTSGTGNTATGACALYSNTTGSLDTASGFEALYGGGAAGDTARGAYAAYANTTGSDNVAIGVSAVDRNQSNPRSTGIGYQAAGAGGSVGFGSQALLSGGDSSDTAIGGSALSHGGSSDTALGHQAVGEASNGHNTAIGDRALGFLGGSEGPGGNACCGSQVFGNATPLASAAIGFQALYSVVPNTWEVADGAGALYSYQAGNATAIGVNAFHLNTGQGTDAAIGYGAFENINGAYGLAAGYLAGAALTSGGYNIFIGDGGSVLTSATGTICIGNPSEQTATYITGIRGITTGESNAVELTIDSNGQLGTVSSSRRYKEDIADMGDASARLLRLRPVTFRYRKPYNDGSKPIQYGLVAEEVAQVFPELAVFNAQGQPESVRYQLLAPLLLNELLKQHQRIEERARVVAAQEQTIARQDRVNAVQGRINAAQQKQIQALTAALEKATQLYHQVARRIGGNDYQPVSNRAEAAANP
jgi:hypothetical protein